MAFVEEIESRWDKDWLQETDKAWDAIHRCLTNGKLEYGTSAFHKCILGDDNLHEEPDYFISYVDADEVKDVANAIKNIDERQMRTKYFAIDAETYAGELDEDDFEYTWYWFVQLQQFFQKAAANDRAVIFTTSQ